MSEREELERAIAHLETQREALGDAVVDLSTTVLQQRLAALFPTNGARQQRKQVTVLLADLSGFTAMSEAMDAEEVTEIINTVWTRLDRVILAHGGVIDKHMGDGLLALWGSNGVQEDDAEQSIRAALAMQEEIGAFAADRPNVSLRMRVGINTGLVLLGSVGITGEFSAIGDAVNLTSRLQEAAPPGTVLISHDTYCHVRGIFDVQPQEPLTIKGKVAPVQTYIVQ